MAFLYGVTRPEPARVWGIYLVNLLFWSSFAITGPAVAGMIQVTEGRWSPSIKRIALTTAGFLPVSLRAVRGALLRPRHALPVGDRAHPGQGGLAQRAVHGPADRAGLLLLYWVAMRRRRRSCCEDQPGRTTQAAIDRRNRLLRRLLLVLYMVVLSLWGFDLLMSLDPIWYSGLFGGYYVVTSMYTGFGLVTYLTIRSNERGLTHVAPPGDPGRGQAAPSRSRSSGCTSSSRSTWSSGTATCRSRPASSSRRFFTQPWGAYRVGHLHRRLADPVLYLLKRLTGRPPERHQVFKVILFFGWIAIFFERMLLVFPALLRDNTVPIGPVEVAGHPRLLRPVRAQPELVPRPLPADPEPVRSSPPTPSRPAVEYGA